jgi:hypothetical protein
MQSKNVRLAALERRLKGIGAELERLEGLDVPQNVRDQLVKQLTQDREKLDAEIQALQNEPAS